MAAAQELWRQQLRAEYLQEKLGGAESAPIVSKLTRRYAQLFDRHRNPLSDEFQQEKKTLEGLERYLVQLWRESLARPGYGPAADDEAGPAA